MRRICLSLNAFREVEIDLNRGLLEGGQRVVDRRCFLLISRAGAPLVAEAQPPGQGPHLAYVAVSREAELRDGRYGMVGSAPPSQSSSVIAVVA